MSTTLKVSAVVSWDFYLVGLNFNFSMNLIYEYHKKNSEQIIFSEEDLNETLKIKPIGPSETSGVKRAN